MKIDFDSVVHLLHESWYGSLASQSIQMPGYPFASVLPFVLDENAHPVFLISQLAEHTKNLTADCRASFIVHDGGAQNVLTAERVSLMGDVRQFDASAELVARYLRYQPDAEQYLGLGGFAFFRLEPKGARYIGGFGRMGWIEEADWASSVVLSLVEEEKRIHSLIEAQPAGIKFLGLDCYGFDFERTGKRERQRFPNGPLAADKIEEAVNTIKAYLETHYRIEGDTPMTLLIGEQNASLATLHENSHVESSAFITAWNPFSQRCDPATNVRRQEDLAHELTKLGLQFVDGIGRHPTSQWAEPSFLVLGLSLDVAKELGARYQQNAIIWAGRDAVPQLVSLR